jgi:hypothetical protein
LCHLYFSPYKAIAIAITNPVVTVACDAEFAAWVAEFAAAVA